MRDALFEFPRRTERLQVLSSAMLIVSGLISFIVILSRGGKSGAQWYRRFRRHSFSL